MTTPIRCVFALMVAAVVAVAGCQPLRHAPRAFLTVNGTETARTTFRAGEPGIDWNIFVGTMPVGTGAVVYFKRVDAPDGPFIIEEVLFRNEAPYRRVSHRHGTSWRGTPGRYSIELTVDGVRQSSVAFEIQP